MSYGHQISDNRRYGATAFGGSGLYGEYFEKQWQGTNRASPDDMTPHNYSKTVNQTYDGGQILPDGRIGSVFAGYGVGVIPLLVWDDNDTLKLSIKLGNKIRDHDFSASIFIAEASESMALIGETATRLAKFFGALKSGKLYKAASFLAGGDKLSRREKYYATMKRHFKNRSAFDDRTALANAILEVQYGWRPMLSDAEGLGKSIAATLSRPIKTSFRVTRKLQAMNVTSNGNNKWTCRKTISHRYYVTVAQPPTWRENLRLGDIGRAITNKTPWLFVANWFLPFEDYMEGRATWTDLHIDQLILTKKITESGAFVGDYSSIASKKYYSFSREVLTTSATGDVFASLFLGTPSFKPIKKSLGWEHMLNGMALLNTTVKRYRN
jgi:hypothetical protein